MNRKNISRHLLMIKHTIFRVIIECVILNFHETIDYKMILRAKNDFLQNILDHHKLTFQKLSAYKIMLKKRNFTGHVHF